MNPGERRQLILDRLEQEASGVCSYEALATALKVSSMTVRRDLGELIRLGTVIRTVGGVQRAQAPSYLYETALHSRLAVNRQEKRGIARVALGLIKSNSTLFIDGSSTCLELARSPRRARRPSVD